MRTTKNVGAALMMIGGVAVGAGYVGLGVLCAIVGFFPFVIGRMADKA